MKVNRIIPILNAITVDAIGDFETAYALTDSDKNALRLAGTAGRLALVITGSSVTGSPSFTFDDLQYSVDGGTNYSVLQYFSPVTISSAAQEDMLEVTAPIPQNITHLKLNGTATQLSGSHKLVVDVDLSCLVA